MSISARWVCHTCMTICHANGNRDYWVDKYRIPKPEQVKDEILPALKSSLSWLNTLKEFLDLDLHVLEAEVTFLEDLHVWLMRHKGHSILVANDYMLDVADMDAYLIESIDGVTYEKGEKSRTKETILVEALADIASNLSRGNVHPSEAAAWADLLRERATDTLQGLGYSYYECVGKDNIDGWFTKEEIKRFRDEQS